MGMFEGVLLFSDYDRTLTDPYSRIPEANCREIQNFIDEGGRFAVATGRSVTMARAFADRVPCNASLILFNGAVAYDLKERTLVFAQPMDLDPRAAVELCIRKFPEALVEVQGLEAHYAFRDEPLWQAFGRANGADYRRITTDRIPGPFVKFTLYGAFRDSTVAQFYEATDRERETFDRMEAWLRDTFGDRCVVDRAATRIIDLQAKGTSKGAAALVLKERLGARTLVCAGDTWNDRSMLEAADLAFVPGDGQQELLERFHRAAPCAEGAVADVIRQLPAFL